MKKLVLVIGFMAAAFTLNAQVSNVDILFVTGTSTNSSPIKSAIEQDIQSIANATNWVVAPYATYGISGEAKGKIGGGVLVGYDFTDNVGFFFAGDYLGKWSLFSGQLQLKLPIHPIASLTNFVVAPDVFTGIGIDGEIVAGGGANFEFGHIKSVVIGAGLAAENVSNAGGRNGLSGNFFFTGRFGF